MLNVYTARIGAYSGADALDVTLGNNARMVSRAMRLHPIGSPQCGGDRGIGMAFTPRPEYLTSYLEARREGRAEQVWQEYRSNFLRWMRLSYKHARQKWETLLSWEVVTLLCFCKDPERCHRTILARDILPALGAEYRGERTPDEHQGSLFE